VRDVAPSPLRGEGWGEGPRRPIAPSQESFSMSILASTRLLTSILSQQGRGGKDVRGKVGLPSPILPRRGRRRWCALRARFYFMTTGILPIFACHSFGPV